MAAGDVWGNRWLASWGVSWGQATTPPEPTPQQPSTGGWHKEPRRKLRVRRHSDIDFRIAPEQAPPKPTPIARPPVVQSAADLDDEDFVIINLLGLLDD